MHGDQMMFRWSIFHENITFETGITHDVVRFLLSSKLNTFL